MGLKKKVNGVWQAEDCTPAQVSQMIADSIDSAISTTSTNAIQNKVITDFVNSSIETATATFRGTYNTLEGLEAASGDKNDYAFYRHTDSAGNTVFDRYKFVPTEQADLPEGYIQLEYIESSGTQYIDTGVNLSSSRGFYMKFMPLALTNYTAFFGLHGYDNRNYSVHYQLIVDNYELNLKYVSYTPVNIVANEISEIDFKPLSLSVNDSVTTVSSQGDWYFSGTNTAALFAYKDGNSFSGRSSMRLYECKMYDSDNTTLLRHFIPCKNASNAIGLYDLVDGTFYPNQGTGSFTAGPQANGYWSYEYTLNNSSFTSEQWAAINSGVKQSDVTKIGNAMEGVDSGTSENDIVLFGNTGKKAKGSGVSIKASTTAMSGSSDTEVPTSKNIAANVAKTATMSSSYAPAQAQAAIAAGDTIEQALGKLEKEADDNKNNILSEQQKTTGMTAGGTDYITVNGIRVYVSATQPTGARTGDLWIGG